VRSLKGLPSQHAAVGRERIAFFFWQGAAGSAADRGASALTTIKLDEEKGPQVRVDQGREDAAFLNLFGGRMTVHRGLRGSRPRSGRSRLFAVRGECAEEAHAFEVDCEADSLRSCGVYALADSRGRLSLWMGSSAPEHVRLAAETWTTNMTSAMPAELGLTSCDVKTEEEGSESSSFRLEVGLDENPPLFGYLPAFSAPSASPRLFHMTAVSGRFEVTEVECLFGRTDALCAMPFNQADLYTVEQPALFMLDAGDDSSLWLWQGWFPELDGEDNNMTGSALVRWHAERRAAMQTAADWRRLRRGWSASTGGKSSMRLAWAGCEPREFVNLFPSWKHRPEVESCNRKVSNGKSR